MKDKRLLWFTLILSLIIGGAEAFSLDAAEIHKALYSFIDTKTGKVFTVQIHRRDEKKFESLLTKDGLVLGKENVEKPNGRLPQYYLLGVRDLREVRPHAVRFASGFFFVWMIYFVIAYLVKHLIVREYKQSLTQKRRKKRRKK